MPSLETNTQTFNLLHEVGKGGTYQLLFPQPQAGLAILELYQKVKGGIFPHGRFREGDIYAALENSKLIINEEVYDRLPQNWFNNIISDLQVYFLRYDTEEQLYTLKDYAELFCRHAEETLLANFNPTQIEIICNDLRQKLEFCDDEKQVDDWINTFFYAFKPVMKNQVDRLERQIDQSVKEIRATTQLQNTSIIDILKAIDEKLDTIRSQNNELRSAFREMKTINNVLEEKLHSVTNTSIADHISDVRRFFPEIKYTLNLIDNRLDRIQPKLRQFFGTLNKPSFNIKVEKFFKFLLAKSTLEHNKSVALPATIPTFRFHVDKPSFTIIERRVDLFPAKPKPRESHIENSVEKEKGIAVAKRHLTMYNKVGQYIDQILNEAKIIETRFSPWFFDIVSKEAGDLEMATNVAYGLIRRAQLDSKIKLEITQERISHPNHQNLSLWEMKVNCQ